MNPLLKWLSERGRTALLARQMNVTHSAIRQWDGVVPAERVVDVERFTGIPREALRPDLYRRDPDPLASAAFAPTITLHATEVAALAAARGEKVS